MTPDNLRHIRADLAAAREALVEAVIAEDNARAETARARIELEEAEADYEDALAESKEEEERGK